MGVHNESATSGDLMHRTAVLQAATEAFRLGRDSDHGPSHWLRVEANGIRLAELTNGANVEVVQLFALLHDCRRKNEWTDPGHGARAAEFAASLRGTLLDMSDADFAQLVSAMQGHDEGHTTTDPTIGCCWDADRLDLGRVGIRPDPAYMSTAAGKELALLDHRLNNDTRT